MPFLCEYVGGYVQKLRVIWGCYPTSKHKKQDCLKTVYKSESLVLFWVNDLNLFMIT